MMKYDLKTIEIPTIYFETYRDNNEMLIPTLLK